MPARTIFGRKVGFEIDVEGTGDVGFEVLLPPSLRLAQVPPNIGESQHRVVEMAVQPVGRGELARH